MTDRRRNLFVLLLVAGLLVASLRGHRDASRRAWASTSRAASRSSTRPSRPSSRRSPATRSTARWTSCASASTRSASPSRASSARAPTRSTSRCPTSRTPTRRPRRSAPPPRCGSTTGRAASSGPNCKPDPQNPNVTGGQAAGDASIPPALSLYDAVTRGAEVPADQHGQGVLGRQVLPGRQGAQEGPGRPRREPRRPAEGGDQQEDPLRRQAGRQGPAGHGDRPRRAARPQGPSRRRPGTSSPTSRSSAARTSRTPSRTSTAGRGRAASPTSPSTSPATARACGRSSRASSRQRGQEFSLGGLRATRPTSTSPSRSTTS